jgi:hypothetical protein
MRRSTSRLAAIAGFALAAVLFAAGGLLIWGSTYTHNMVHQQLAAQQIYFPPKTAFAHPDGKEITSGMIPSVSQYAGQQLVTGQQAQSYADNFIAVHITGMTGGKTYAQLSAASLAQPDNTKLAGLVATVFKGETLRAILLNAFGWWKVSQITYIASLISFGLGGLVLLGSLSGLTLRRRPEITHEAIPATGGQAPAKAS